MSSVSRGNAFEDRVFEAIKRQLAGVRLGLSPRLGRPFKKKSYYSRDRESDIIVDISIEVWLPDADQWSMLWVCECKDHSGAVPVSDVEEFKAKLDQITGANRKGLMAVTGALQPGALKYAYSNGIGVVRLLPDNQVEYLLYMMTPDMQDRGSHFDATQFSNALTQPAFVGKNKDFYAIAEGQLFEDWHSLLKKTL
jgi:hypothetical protein